MKKIKAWAYIDKFGRIGNWDSRSEQGMRIVSTKSATKEKYKDQYGITGRVIPVEITYELPAKLEKIETQNRKERGDSVVRSLEDFILKGKKSSASSKKRSLRRCSR